VLSLLHNKFIDPLSPVNADGTVSIQFLPHWHQVLLLPLFLCLLRLYLKPLLHLTDHDYQLVVWSFEELSAPDIANILGISLKTIGCHLHIICSVTILEQLCLWTSSDPLLDYFLHLGGDLMIILGDILACDDVQQTISQLLTHVGSPSHHSMTSQMSSCHSSCHDSLHTHGSQSSSHGSLTGTHVIISDPPNLILW